MTVMVLILFPSFCLENVTERTSLSLMLKSLLTEREGLGLRKNLVMWFLISTVSIFMAMFYLWRVMLAFQLRKFSLKIN